MRATLRQLLIAGVPAVAGRVYEPSVPTAATQKPYLVVKETTGEAEAEWADYSTTVEVWPQVDETSFRDVDTICKAVETSLHRVRFDEGGKRYLAWYVGSDPDFADPEWETITRRMRFRVFALGWMGGLTYSPDPVAAMRTWTDTTFPGQVQTDPGTWNPQNAQPGAYWRLTDLRAVAITAWGAWMEASLRCHIVAPGPSDRLTWTRRIAEQAARSRRTRLADNSPLDFGQIVAASDADPMRQGQITLTASYGVVALDPPPIATPLNHAYAAGDVEGAVHASP